MSARIEPAGRRYACRVSLRQFRAAGSSSRRRYLLVFSTQANLAVSLDGVKPRKLHQDVVAYLMILAD